MTLAEVAEEIVTREMPNSQKVSILLAMVRALSAPRRPWLVESARDVDRMLLADPDGFERLLRAYWRLLGAGSRAA